MDSTRASHGNNAAEEPVVIVYGPELASYTFGPDHPLQPLRYQATVSLLESLGWLGGPGVSREVPRPATMSELLAAHTWPYIQAVQLAQSIARGQHEPVDLQTYGLGTADDPLFPDMHDASLLAAGASVYGMKALLQERARHAYNPCGGYHHAHRSYASGFCIYNDCAVAIAAAVAAGWRVAYVDLDAHHGDGVQAIFYEEPRVLTVSVHESGEFLFPGTGTISETGAGAGKGTAINVPLPPFAGNESFLLALDRVVVPAVRAFAPDVLVTQTGADTHHSDPLTHLSATMPLYPQLADRLHRLAHDCCEGRWLIVGGGGYDPVDVTPRAWTAFIGTVLGHETSQVELPLAWVRTCRAAGGDPPAHLLDDDTPTTLSSDLSKVEAVIAAVERGPLTELFALRQRN